MYAEFKMLSDKPVVFKVLSGLFAVFFLLELVIGLRRFFLLNLYPVVKIPAVAVRPKVVPIPRERILNCPLFGDFVPENLSGMTIKRSLLHLKLIGVVMSADEKKSHVILEMPNKKERVFYLGDQVPGGAVIQKITADEIFVVRNGEVERLSLPEKGLSFGSLPKPLDLGE